MIGFSWVIPKQLAGLAMPGMDRSIGEDARELQQNGVRLLVSLTHTPADPTALARYDIAPLHLPVEDFQPPTVEQLRRFVTEANLTISQGGGVAVHCGAGRGRTGTALAAFLVARGMPAGKAIQEVRRLRPGSIETTEQEDVLYDFEASVGKDGRLGPMPPRA